MWPNARSFSTLTWTHNHEPWTVRTNKYNNIKGYKINIQNQLCFYNTNNKLSGKKKHEENIYLQKHQKQYLGTNLILEINDLYKENQKMLKEIKEVTNKWKGILCSWIGSILLKYL